MAQNALDEVAQELVVIFGKIPSKGEAVFLLVLKAEFSSLYRSVVQEHRFHPTRKWRFDFAWPEKMVAVEIDGGIWIKNGGRHNQDSDREKINTATEMGWRVFRFSTSQVTTDPMSCVQKIRKLLSE